MSHSNFTTTTIKSHSPIYSHDTVHEATLKYFDGDTLATDVWINKYCLKTPEGALLEKTPDDLHKRLAREFSRIENNYLDPVSYDEIYTVLKDFRYIIPQGSPMAGIGNNNQTVSIANCFVIGNDADSYSGILSLDQELVHLMKRRGGVGLDISHIRPKGISVNNAAISSTGVVPFMERFSNTTREVAQDGRRGALMISISSDHPDVEDFITAKLELNKVTGANISVKLTNKFMQAVEEKTNYTQQFPVDSDLPILKKEVNAKHLFKKLVHASWRSAEPGILFWDKIIEESPADCYAVDGFKTVSVNPCVTGDTLIFTTIGWIQIQNLTAYIEEYPDLKIITRDKNGILTNSDLEWVDITHKNDEIYKVHLSTGAFITTNSKHKLYDTNFNEVSVLELEGKEIIGGDINPVNVTKVEKTDLTSDVWDLTAVPNYNFFSISGLDEVVYPEKIIVNDDISYSFFTVVNLKDEQQKFAYELDEGDDLV